MKIVNKKFDKPYCHCPICGSEKVNHLLKDFRDIDIHICKNCHVQFMNPVYSDSYLEDFYSTYTHESHSQQLIDEQSFTANDNLSVVEKLLGCTGTMLDYGCGNGGHSGIAKQRGWRVVGYDVDCNSTKNIANKFTIDYQCGNFEEVDWQNKTFDLIYTNQVVEHLKNPIKTFDVIHRLLKKDGVFLVAIPNIHSLSARVKFFLDKSGLRRKHIGKYYDSNHHVFYYDKKSIKNLLKIAGFEVVLIQNSKKPRSNQNPIVKFIMRTVLERFIPNSAMLVIAKKTKK